MPTPIHQLALQMFVDYSAMDLTAGVEPGWWQQSGSGPWIAIAVIVVVRVMLCFGDRSDDDVILFPRHEDTA